MLMNDTTFRAVSLPSIHARPEMSMESFTTLLKMTAFTINFCVAIVNARRIIEAWIIRRGEINLEKTRLQLKAELINERAERFHALNAERLIRGEGLTL